MKPFKAFGDYIYYLLTMPFKKVAEKTNQWYIFSQVVGTLFDDAMQDLVWVRKQKRLDTCDDATLQLHGAERDMPRLTGETYDAWRARLKRKGEIARQAGTSTAIALAVDALGYSGSRVEPYYLYDTDKWAEFIVWLRFGSSSVGAAASDLTLVDTEVCKVKQASSLPNYGVEAAQGVEITKSVIFGQWYTPWCGTFYCGQYPPRSDEI